MISLLNLSLPLSIQSLRKCYIKKISVKKQKLRAKLWITKGILISIKNKNKIYRKYCHAKNQTRRDELHNLFKKYRNSIN